MGRRTKIPGSPTPAPTKLISYGLAFVAGGISLIAQIAWERAFTQLFGATSQGVAITLGVFLCGLALGALRLGRLADRSPNPLRLAGTCLTLSGVSMSLGILVLKSETFGPASLVGSDGVIPMLMRMTLAALIILPPTLLLGGVVPALMSANEGSNKLRRRFSAIFGLETLGGAVGALAAGFYCLGAWGIHGTLLFAGTLSWIAGGFVVSAARRTEVSIDPNSLSAGLSGSREESADSIDGSPASPASDASPAPDASALWVLAAISFAGFATLGMEVAWTRLLLLILGSDTHAFTVVVTSFLVGLSLGGLIANRLTPYLARPLDVFVTLQLLIAGCSLILMFVFGWLSGGIGQRWLISFDGDWRMALVGRFVLSAGLLVVPAVLIGLSFPVAASYFFKRQNGVGSLVGRLYAASAAGNIAGAFVVGFWLISSIGLQRSIFVLAMMNLISAAFVVLPRYRWRSNESNITGYKRIATATQAALIVIGLAGCCGWVLLRPIQPLGLDTKVRTDSIIDYQEGIAGTVIVRRSSQDPDERLMSIDGVIIGESRGGVDEKQRVLAHLPFLFRPECRHQRLLTIGLGTGILAGELVRSDQAKEVVCVELSQAVIDGAKHFAELNGNLHSNPRASIVRADGIHYVRHDRTQFDAIISDAKSRPGHIGNAAFYSSDFYTSCQQRLTTNGLMAQWISLETPPHALRIILKTFTSSFPQSYIGIAAPDSLYLIGTNQPLTLDINKMQDHLDSPHADRLRQYGWQTAADFMALLMADGSDVQTWLASDTPVNTLDWPVIEFQSLDIFRSSAKARKQDNLSALKQMVSMASGELGMNIKEDDVQKWKKSQRAAWVMLDAAAWIMSGKTESLQRASDQLEEARGLQPQPTRMLWMAAQMHFQQGESAELNQDTVSAIHHYKASLRYRTEDVNLRHRLAILMADSGDLAGAAGQFYEALQIEPASILLRIDFARHLIAMNKPSQAARQYKTILENHPDEARAHLGLGLVSLRNNRLTEARIHLERAAELDTTLRYEVSQLIHDLPDAIPTKTTNHQADGE